MFLGQPHHVATKVIEILRCLLNVVTDACADLDHGLVHPGLNAFLKPQLSLCEHLRLDVRAQVAGLGIDRLVFLFNSKREAGRIAFPGRLSAPLSADFDCLVTV